MSRKSFFLRLAAVAFLFMARPALAVPVTFVIDPANSHLNFNGFAVVDAFDTLSLSGTLMGDLEINDTGSGYSPGSLSGFEGIVQAGDLDLYFDYGFLGFAEYIEQDLQFSVTTPAPSLSPTLANVGFAEYNPGGAVADFLAAGQVVSGSGGIGAIVRQLLEQAATSYTLPLLDKPAGLTIQIDPFSAEGLGATMTWSLNLRRIFFSGDSSSVFNIEGQIVAKTAAVPEPSAAALMGFGAALLGAMRWRRGRRGQVGDGKTGENGDRSN